MPKAKRLNGIWGGRARRALGAAIIAMVLVFARALAALGQGQEPPEYPHFIQEIIDAYETKIDGDENLKADEKKQRIDGMKAYVHTDKELCLKRAFNCRIMSASDNQDSGDFFSSPEFENLFFQPVDLSSGNNAVNQNCIKMSSEWYYFKVYENCIKETYRGISSSDDKSFDPHRFFVSELAWMIDQRNPGMSDLYSTLDEVYKMVNPHSMPTLDATFVPSDTPDPSKTEQARIALAQTESARTQAEQAQIATETAQAQTARAIGGDGNHSVQSAPSNGALGADILSTGNPDSVQIQDFQNPEVEEGQGLNLAPMGPAGNENGSDKNIYPPAPTPTPIPTPTSTATLTARPIETTVPGTDSVDINPLAPSKTDVSTPGGIWDKIKKYLRELIIAAAGLVGIGAVWTLIRKRKRRPARPERIRPAAARPAPVRPAAAPEARDIREPRENRTLRLEDGVGTDPKTMEIQAMSAFLKFDFGNMQHQGRRDYQEDSFGFSDISDPELVAKRGILAIVADGMGGLKNGKSISERAIGKFRKAFLNFSPAGNIPRQLSSLVAETNHDIYETDRQKGGTTLICVYIYRNGMHWVSVGDSAIFLFRQGRLYQLNKEHNRLNELYLKFMYREITKEQLMAEPSLQGLTSNIGRRELRDLDQNLTGLRLQSGDRILLCTDGVSGRLTEKELLVAMSQGTAQACADVMKSMVLKKNAPKQDNLTAEVICCD